MSESIEKTIDIDKILKSKMGSKAKYVPRFLVSWLKKIVHEDEVNRFLWESRNLSGTEWLTECVRYLKMDVEIVGLGKPARQERRQALYLRFQSSVGRTGRRMSRFHHRTAL